VLGAALFVGVVAAAGALAVPVMPAQAPLGTFPFSGRITGMQLRHNVIGCDEYVGVERPSPTLRCFRE
jgi:hypothetical protein